MSSLHCIELASVDQLRAAASAWDDLWWRSDVALPTARAELLAQWIEQFKPRARFHAIVVAEQQRWIAALPLVSRRVGWLIPAGGLPGNAWSPCGDLLLDPTVDSAAALDLLMAAAAKLSWQLLWLNGAAYEAPRWRALLQACQHTGVASSCHQQFRSGRVEIDRSWDIYQKRLPKSHRQGMPRALRRLSCEGDVQFEMRSQMAVEDIEPWLQAAFAVEDRSWKGAAGTSVLRTPGMFRFFVRQAEQLARWGQLEAASLRLDDQLVAFIHGFRAKGVYFAHKIGYDPRFAAFSPGQLLFHHIIERLHGDSDIHALDFMGPLTQATSRWRPVTYGIGRVALAPRRLLGSAAIYAYKHWWRPLRDLKAIASDPVVVLGDDDSDVLEPAGTAS